MNYSLLSNSVVLPECTVEYSNESHCHKIEFVSGTRHSRLHGFQMKGAYKKISVEVPGKNSFQPTIPN